MEQGHGTNHGTNHATNDGTNQEHEPTATHRSRGHLHLHPNRGEFEGVLGLLAGLAMSVGRGRSARLVADLAGVGPGDRVVDVGSGPGRLLKEAAERGAEAVGVEPSGQMRRVAGWRIPAWLQERVRVLDGTAERIPLEDGTATVVSAVASFHHWADPEAGLAEVHRVLRPGGRVVIAERLARPGGWFRHHAMTWEQGQRLVAQAEQAGFSDVTAGSHALGRGRVLAVQARRPAGPTAAGTAP